MQNMLQMQGTVEIAAPAGFALATDDFAFHATRPYDRCCGGQAARRQRTTHRKAMLAWKP
ncbi:hypothetical protein [Cupriavidus sp. CP313]